MHRRLKYVCLQTAFGSYSRIIEFELVNGFLGDDL